MALTLRVALLNGRAKSPPAYALSKEDGWMKQLSKLKLAIAGLYSGFAVIIALGELFGVDAVILTGLLAFAAGVGLTTYYLALTQP